MRIDAETRKKLRENLEKVLETIKSGDYPNEQEQRYTANLLELPARLEMMELQHTDISLAIEERRQIMAWRDRILENDTRRTEACERQTVALEMIAAALARWSVQVRHS